MQILKGASSLNDHKLRALSDLGLTYILLRKVYRKQYLQVQL